MFIINLTQGQAREITRFPWRHSLVSVAFPFCRTLRWERPRTHPAVLLAG